MSLRSLQLLAVVGVALCGCSDKSNAALEGDASGGRSSFGQSGSTIRGGTANSVGGTGAVGVATSGGSFGLGGAATAGGVGPGIGGNTSVGGASQTDLLNFGGAAQGGRASVSGGGKAGSVKGGGANGGGSTNRGGNGSAGKPSTGAGGSASPVGTSAAAGSVVGGRANLGGMNAAAGGANGGKATGGSSNGGTSSSAGASNPGTAPIKIWIAGDSTVQTCKSACPCGWGGELASLFNAQVSVVNSAVSGRSIQTWLYEGAVSSTLSGDDCSLTSTTYNSRWTAMTNATTGMKAGDYLFIQFGINDGDKSCPRHVSSKLFQTYLGVMAQAAQAVGAHPVFLTPTNAITCSGSKVAPNRGFLSEIKAAGTAEGAAVIDLNQLTIDLYTKLGFCPNNDDYSTGAIGDFFCEDHTHFEAAGAKQVAALVAQAIRAQNLGLAAYLK